MRKYKFLLKVFTFLSMSLMSIACIDTDNLQIPQMKESKIQSKELCDFITNELRFCIEKQKIVTTQPELIALNFSLTNISKHEIEVNKYDGGNYIFKVTNEKGEIILTKLEQKIRKGKISEDDKKTFVNSLIRNHQSITLQSGEIYNEKITLGETYDFTSIGKYYVQVIRKTRDSVKKNTVATSLKNIQIEVK